MGTFLIIDSALVLITAEHPTIGTVQLFGQVFWLGWLMIGAMVLTGVPPVILGHLKMELADELHDKVLYADADMNKADWMTALGSIIGVTGIGLGLWWLDAVAALFIAVTILCDGIKNTRAAVTDLMDARAATFDDAKPHPVIDKINDYLRGLDWVADAGARVRDEGHVFHAEAFVVPAPAGPGDRRARQPAASTWTGVCTMSSSSRSPNSPRRFPSANDLRSPGWAGYFPPKPV